MKLRKFLAALAAAIVLLTAAIAGNATSTWGGAQQSGPRGVTTLVLPIGDSITYGVNAQTKAGWREESYNDSRSASVANWLYYIGTQSFAGNSSGMAADPFNEGHPGYCVATGIGACGSLISVTVGLGTPMVASNSLPGIVILAGGTNDLASNVGNQTAAATATAISTWLDDVWAARGSPRLQIVLCQVLKRLDSDDTKVQALNALLPGIVSGKSYAANVTIAPTYNAIQNPSIGLPTQTGNPTGGYNDVVHPNDLGYTQMGDVLWSVIQPLIPTAQGWAN